MCSIIEHHLPYGDASMTKTVRIENADSGDGRVRVRILEKAGEEAPDIGVGEAILPYTANLEEFGVHEGRYLIVEYLPPAKKGSSPYMAGPTGE